MSQNEPHIIIGEDRFITVPESLKKIAVQYDHNVETVVFDCPRYWDEHDLSTMNIYVNYLRMDGVSGRTPCTIKTVDANDPSLMQFTWTVPRHATEVNGTLAILVCIKSTDAEGSLIRDWNSEICNDFYVSEGFEVEKEQIDSYEDTLEAWYQSVVNMAVTDISQTTTSTENFGVNVITATFGDGSTKKFEVRNGGVEANTQVGYFYSITLEPDDWQYMGESIGRYSVTKTVPNLTNSFVVFPAVSDNNIWIDLDLDVVIDLDQVVISVNSLPEYAFDMSLTLVNAINGGVL